MAFAIDRDKIMMFDGAMGTMLQNRGLKIGELPEILNITQPDIIKSIHKEYLDAGADIITTNTFGANPDKAAKANVSLDEIVASAVRIAKEAAGEYSGKYVALDIGPCGKVMAPSGQLSFDDAVSIFAKTVRAGSTAGADLILLETFTDLYELKAALIAAKENSDLPIIATMSFEENGSTFFGTVVESMVMTLESLGVSALGVNCSLGPKQLAPIVKRILSASTLPVIVQPNAGLPVMRDGTTKYDITPLEFAKYMKEFAEEGVLILGGCCGTSPKYISLTKELVSGILPPKTQNKRRASVASPSRPVFFGDDVVIIGERLNPTGKKALKAAIKENNVDYILREAISQQEQGANILDVNMGLPDIDEPAVLGQMITKIQAVCPLPLQIDSSSPAALEAAARVYNGKPLVNSVNGKEESLASVLPIVKKYGCAVLGLTLDDDGIPKTAEKRFEIAKKIVTRAESYGIPREDVLIDCLVMTASAQQEQANETLSAIRMVKERLGVKTVLGVSNVSFGLPLRPLINRTMLTMALMQGLDAPIMNPGDDEMSGAVAAFRVLTGKDKNSASYIAKFSGKTEGNAPKAASETISLGYAIACGLKKEAESATEAMLAEKTPLEVIETNIIPALDAVGRDYEMGTIFLPQLIQSAEAAKASFERLQKEMTKDGDYSKEQIKRKKVIVATVHGDIHDIGKNIVKVIMENYNFDVIDLGNDVPPQKVADTVKETGTQIVGLSALMTTTVASMKTTIELLRKECSNVRIIVGGAVLSPDLANYVGADHYAKDAMETVRFAGL